MIAWLNQSEARLVHLLNELPLSPATLLVLTVSVLIGVHYYYKNLYSYWHRRGVPGPKPWPLVGNALDLFVGDRLGTTRKWQQQFGRVCGIYEGVRPVLFVADPDVMRQVCIKDFDVFSNHDNNAQMSDLQKSFIFLLQDDKWKRVRSMLSPTFTSGKMRRMYKLMELCVDDLVQVMEEQFESNKTSGSGGGPIINVKSVYSLYTMDAIASCCYGLKLDRQKSADLETAAHRNEFVACAMKMFEFKIWRVLMVMSLNKHFVKYFDLRMIPESNINPFASRVKQFIEKRGNNKTTRFDDYLQILLDAKNSSSKGAGDGHGGDANELDSMEAHHAGVDGGEHQTAAKKQDDSKGKAVTVGGGSETREPLEDIVILSNAAFLLTVGLETTATLLAHCTYALAFHEHIQDRLLREVKLIATIKKDADSNNLYSFEYDSLISCHYLDSVLSETLRALTPVLQTDRIAKYDYVIDKYNISLPAGAKLLISLQDVMMDPEYWPEPEKFDPERFMPENRDKIVPGAYCPFGLGPRHCLGMRFSLTEAKFALARLIVQYKFKPAPDTKYPPEFKRNFGLNGLKKPLVELARRDS